MTDAVDPVDATPQKKSKKPLIIGLLLAIAGGAGGFFAVNSGLIGGSSEHAAPEEESAVVESETAALAAFVALDPLVISLPGNGGRTHLRFSAQLEVASEFAAEVEGMKPRVADVLNSYLRAVKLEELDDPTALVKLRSQMLRRIQIVTGSGRVRDLLIMEFVLN